MERTKWVDRSFEFNYPAGILPSVIERLIGTTYRLHAIENGIPDSLASVRSNGKWSIKEHVGHLVDLEDLHISRLGEFLERKPALSAADMKNKRTESADHNANSMADLISAFSTKRQVFVKTLSTMNDETQLFQALHPRLRISMRPVDVATFTAEHDDHHFASIREILNIS